MNDALPSEALSFLRRLAVLLTKHEEEEQFLLQLLEKNRNDIPTQTKQQHVIDVGVQEIFSVIHASDHVY